MEIKKKEKRNLINDDYEKFEILGYYFNVESSSFKRGIIKIAFNYALEKDIPLQYMKDILVVEKEDNDIKSIEFNTTVVPFIALNHFDRYLELNTKIQLYHNLILFNVENVLWCYVDLFNTFQFYVLLSTTWTSENIYEPYFQTIQKIDREIPQINVFRTKHIINLASYYNIQPTYDVEKLKKDITAKIRKEPYVKDMNDIISSKFGLHYINNVINMGGNNDEITDCLESLSFYFDEEDRLKNNLFRSYSPSLSNDKSEVAYYSYPDKIIELWMNNNEIIRKYTHSKFLRLNEYLCGHEK